MGAKRMTEGAPWKHILFFALPLIAGHFLQQLYNTVDGIVVGQFVSSEALGAVGVCTTLCLAFLCLAIGMSNGCAVVFSQFFGAKRIEDLRKAVATGIIILVAMGLFLTGVGYIIGDFMLKSVLAVPENYLADSQMYFRIYISGLAFQFLFNVCSAILRSLGDSKATLYFLIVSSVSNVALDLLFVCSFKWGVMGAAVATVISHILSAVVAVIYMFKKYEMLRFQRGEFKFYPHIAKIELKMAIPTTLQQFVVSLGSIALQRLVSTFELTTPGLLPGYTAGQRIEQFMNIPAFSMQATMSVYTGQNVGAGKYERIKTGRVSARIIGIGIQLVIGIVAFVLRHPLIRLFGVTGAAEEIGVEFLTTMIPMVFLFVLSMSTLGTLIGAGDTVFASFNSISMFVFRCAMAYLLAFTTPLGYRMIWLNLPLGWIYSIIMTEVRYAKGKWKEKAVVKHDMAVHNAQQQEEQPAE